jgi:hypothetical protein
MLGKYSIPLFADDEKFQPAQEAFFGSRAGLLFEAER